MLKNTEREAVEQQEKNEPGAVSKKAKEILSRPPKPERAERPYKEKPPAKESNKPKSKSSANERQRPAAFVESSDSKVGLKDEVKSVQSKKKTHVDQDPDTTASKSSSGNRNSASQASEHNNETERPSKRQSERESEKEKKEKIRNKDRPTIQIYRPGAKRLITTKSSVS